MTFRGLKRYEGRPAGDVFAHARYRLRERRRSGRAFEKYPPPLSLSGLEGWVPAPPDFVGVGVQRAGSTRWFDLISRHPSVHRDPLRPKELHFFDHMALEPDVGDARLRERYADHFKRPGGMLAGEWTPRYCLDFWVMPMLRRAAPDTKVLITLRDPVERYRSAINHLQSKAKRRRQQTLPVHLVEAAERGRYASQLEWILEWFPREQVLVLQYEKCCADPGAELERTWRFLGLEPVKVDPADLAARINPVARTVDDEPGVLDSLGRYLAADTARLAELVPELDLSLWNVAGADL